MSGSNSKVLVFGGSGYIGKHIVKASLLLKHPTYVYSRPLNPLSPQSKIKLLREFEFLGANIVHGKIEVDEIVGVIEKVDIVICALAYPQVMEQFKIIEAVKKAGNIKRFLPSDFGCEEDRVFPLASFEAILENKRKIRRAIEAANIPYTFVSVNCLGSYFVNVLLHPHDDSDDITIFGDGNAKAVLNYEDDVGMYTVKVAQDPKTCNKVVVYRPPNNIISQLELVSLWEKKKGRNFNRVFVSEEEIVKLSQSLPPPQNVQISIIHSLFVKGDLVNFDIEDELEASKLYPDIDYTTIDELLDVFLNDPPPPARTPFL